MRIATTLKPAIKQLVWACCRHERRDAKDILLFSTRRSGSTLLMETIAAGGRIRYIDQPFSLFRASKAHRKHLPNPPLSQFITLDEEDERRVRDFVEKLLQGDLWINAPWEFWASDFNFRTSRSVLKIVDAKPLIDWFDQNFEVQIVFSTRHPIPTSLSIIRNGWGLTAPAYLANEEFMRRLTDRQVAFAHDVMRSRKELTKYVLNWTLENLVPLRLLPTRKDWLFISYEQATSEPERTIRMLADRLDLRDENVMLNRFQRPSRSTRKLHSVSVGTEMSQSPAESWRRDVTDDDVREATKVLDVFEIALYT